MINPNAFQNFGYGKKPSGKSKATQAVNGREIQLRTDKEYIQWRYKGDKEWLDLVALKKLRGPEGKQGIAGKDGIQGPAGIDGKPGEKGEPGQDGNIGAIGPQGPKGDTGEQGPRGLQGITGPEGAKGEPGIPGKDGNPGKDGQEVELRTSDKYIQWKYVTQSTWNNLILIEDLKGPRGERGERGPKGDKGERGPMGYTGSAGPAGPKGDKGDPGEGGDGLWTELDSDKLQPIDSARKQIHLGGESSIIDLIAPGATFLATRADGSGAGLISQVFGSGALAPTFFAIRGRGTHGSPTASGNGDTVLNLAGTGYTSSNQPGIYFGQIAGMNIVVEGTPGATTVPMSVEINNNQGSVLKTHQGRNLVIGSGSATPEEKLNIQGRMELLAQSSAPTGRTSYGKVWVKNDGDLYYTDPDNNTYNLITADGENYQPLLALETRTKYALVGGGTWANYDNQAFQLPNPGDFTDGGFDVYIEYVPLWGTRDPSAPANDSYQELFSIEHPTAWGGDLLEMAIVHRGKDAYQFLEFTSPSGTSVNGYGEDPVMVDYDYYTHYLHHTRVRYTHDPTTGVTKIWRPIKFGETAEQTAHGVGWITSQSNNKGGAYAIDTNDTNEPWKIGKGAGRFLVARVVVNQYDGTAMADFNAEDATDELTVPDPIAGVDWTSSGSFAKIVDTEDIVKGLTGQAVGGASGYSLALPVDYNSTYAYAGYEHISDGSWYIYRRTRATNVRQYATGSSDFATNWTGRAGLTYS